VLQPPASDDYYTGNTPPLEFLLDDLLGGTADEIGGTRLTGAPPVTQPMQQTQEQQRARMEGFHDSARRESEALAMAALVEAEARATRGGRPVGLGDSIGSDRRGASRLAQRLHKQRPEGGCPVGLRCSLSNTAPSRRSEDAIAIHATPSRARPTTRGLHRGWRQRRGRSTRACRDRRSAIVFRFVFGYLSCTLLCFF
jgi:hypothetical protein